MKSLYGSLSILVCTVVASADNRIDLQALVDGRADGDTLQLETGRYSAAVIDRPLILRGRGEATVVDGGGSGTGTVLALKAPGVRIEQLRVTGSGSDIMAKESGIWIDRAAPDAHIRQVRLDSCGFGIWADRAARPLMANCTVIGRDDAAIVSDLGNGIHLFNVEGGIVRDNQIVAGRDGIYISNSSGCLIEGNRVRGSRFAIHYMYAHQNRVIDNSTDSSSVGIALMYSKRIQVRHNRVRNARNHGMLLRNLYASRVEGNDVRGSRDGFFFSGCQADTLAGNRIAANEIGIQVSDSPTNLLVANAFLDNEQQLVYEGYSHVVWEGGENGGNYWSDYIGWDRDGDGIGDKRHYPSDIATHLVGRFPALRLVLHSPAMLLLQGLEAQFPMMRPPGVMEARPLMHLPATREEL